MKVKIIKSGRVNLLSGVVEVTREEADRLFILGMAEPVVDERLPEEKVVKRTRKKQG